MGKKNIGEHIDEHVAEHVDEHIDEQKVLLALMPFWAPLIPPLGITCLKTFLQRHGFTVRTIDANIEQEFEEIYGAYLDTLKENIPGDKRGNFYNIGNDVLRNHMMIHMNGRDEAEYIELVKLVIFKNFFCDVSDEAVGRLGEILDGFYSRLETYLLGVLDEEKPSVLGLSVFNGTLAASLFVLRFAKEKYPRMKTVIGGGIFTGELALGSPNLETLMEQAPYIDKFFVGEGEILFLKYLRGELQDSRRLYTLADIDNELLDISKAEVPDFSDLDIRFYPDMATYTSRGCPFRCSFCSETVRWGTYRKKGAEQVVKEMKHLHEKYGCQLFLMGDSLLNPVIKDVSQAFLNEDVPLYWDGYLRADRHVTEMENTLLWRRGGFYRARLGLESGSPRILEAMGKKISIDQMKTAVSNLASVGIKTTTYWVIGHPGETEEDFRQTLELIEELRDDIYEADCNPFNYFYSGQVDSDKWSKDGKSIPLYPENARRLLTVQTWILDCEPSREEMYQRVVRFMDHCAKLGISNPYSMRDIYNADQRWKKLHKNAVPSLVELMEGNTYIDESRNVKQLTLAKNPQQDDGDWGF
jgi:hypothetical protein